MIRFCGCITSHLMHKIPLHCLTAALLYISRILTAIVNLGSRMSATKHHAIIEPSIVQFPIDDEQNIVYLAGTNVCLRPSSSKLPF